ncbi:hypothetical protein K439DRAFT_1658117 [Ramaria rubella]|nr:hypothetical protein K439DRAFT_1658117 [Ramaria rubella]
MASELQPVDPASITETETEARWIVRKLTGSMTGRIVMSSYETLRAAGTSVICLSPWGDSSPLLLPCIRFRDLVVHMVIAATGGTAAIAAPVMGPMGDAFISTFGDTIIVELGLHAGFELGVKAGNDLIIEDTVKYIMPANDRRLTTTAIKSLTITLKFKHTTSDAALGFFRSSVHSDTSLFSSVKDYLAIEKGWFSPYLFASGRRPIIPRTMTPDVVFCHGPFLGGDYKIGIELLKESATVIHLCKPPALPSSNSADETSSASQTLPSPPVSEQASRSYLRLPSLSGMITHTTDIISQTTDIISRSRSPSRSRPSSRPPSRPSSRPPSPSPAKEDLSGTTMSDPSIPSTILPPRRMVLVVLGIKPHRRLWSTSARPGESVIEYILLNGCPAIVLPVKAGSPLIAWDTLTLEQLHQIGKKSSGVESEKARGVANVIYEYLGLCVDWRRMLISGEKSKETAEGVLYEEGEEGENGNEGLLEERKTTLKDAVKLLVTGAINSGNSKEAKKKVDLDRAGIVMFRIP